MLMEHGERRVKVEPGVITIPHNLQEVKAIKRYSGFRKKKRKHKTDPVEMSQLAAAQL